MLQSLQYVDSSGAVQLKGRVACQISSHELLLTELLFENALSPLAPEESAALLSCLVFQQKTQVEPHITNTLQEVWGNWGGGLGLGGEVERGRDESVRECISLVPWVLFFASSKLIE